MNLVVTAMVGMALFVADDDFTRNRPVDQAEQNERLDALEGLPAPPIDGELWANTDALTWEQLRGKVVLLDFWGVWCNPCVRAIPKLSALYKARAEDGFVVIGVHTHESLSNGQKYVEREKVPYPVVFDKDDVIAKRYSVESYPGYYLVDANGVLRAADLLDSEIERAVDALIAERDAQTPEESEK